MGPVRSTVDLIKEVMEGAKQESQRLEGICNILLQESRPVELVGTEVFKGILKELDEIQPNEALTQRMYDLCDILKAKLSRGVPPQVVDAELELLSGKITDHFFVMKHLFAVIKQRLQVIHDTLVASGY